MLELGQNVWMNHNLRPLKCVLNTKGSVLDKLSTICVKTITTGTLRRINVDSVWFVKVVSSTFFDWPTLSIFDTDMHYTHKHTRKFEKMISGNNNYPSYVQRYFFFSFQSISDLFSSLSPSSLPPFLLYATLVVTYYLNDSKLEIQQSICTLSKRLTLSSRRLEVSPTPSTEYMSMISIKC